MPAIFALAAAAISLSASAQAAAPEVYQRPVNVSIPNSSPLLVYQPQEADPSAANYTYSPNLWNTTFVRRPWTEWQPNTLGRGESSHRTNKTGNRVSVSWLGTEVYFYGSCENYCKVSLSVNGGPEQEFTPGQGNGSLAYYTDPSAKANSAKTATLTLKEGAIGVSNVYLTSIIPTYAKDVTATSQISLNSTTGVDLNINPAIDSMKPDGSVWNAVHELGNDLDRMIYRRIDTNEAKSYAQFRIPANTTLVTLRGTVNLDHGNYSVTVDPPPPGSNSNGKTVLHGFATWSIPDMPLYVAPLDPGTSYTIRIENLDNKWFDLAGATFYTLNSADAQKAGQGASHGLSAGAIAGIVVGCVLGVLIIGALIGYCLWRRCYAHRYNRPPSSLFADNERFVVDHTVKTTQYTMGSSGRGSVQTADVSTLGYTHFTPLGEGDPEYSEKPQAVRQSSYYASSVPTSSTPARSSQLAPLEVDLKRHLTGLDPVPLSPSVSGRPSFSRNGSGLMVPPPESELATYASGSTSSRDSLREAQQPRETRPRRPLVDYVNAEDAGPVPTQIEIMPPSYNPEWADSAASLRSNGTGPRSGAAAAVGGEANGERTGSPARMNSIVKAAKGLI